MCYQGDLCGCPQPLLQLPRGAYAVAAWHTGAARPSHGGTGGEHVTAHLSGPRPKGGERDPTSSGIRAQGEIREGQRWGGLCCKGTGSGEGVSAPSSSWVVFVCLVVLILFLHHFCPPNGHLRTHVSASTFPWLVLLTTHLQSHFYHQDALEMGPGHIFAAVERHSQYRHLQPSKSWVQDSALDSAPLFPVPLLLAWLHTVSGCHCDSTALSCNCAFNAFVSQEEETSWNCSGIWE